MVWKTLLGTSSVVAVTAVVGAVASSDTNSAWYRVLRKPSFQPAAIAFPVVWTALYTDLAVVSAVVLDHAKDKNAAKRFRARFLLNLVLNGSWSWVFFKAHRLGPATAVASVLALSTFDLIREAGRTDSRAAAALVPYAVWCSFATVLSAAIWRRNPTG